MNIQTKAAAARTLRNELLHFHGSDTVFYHALNRSVLYTEGVQRFAESAGAYWLLDILATEPAILKEARDFTKVTLDVGDHNTAVILVTDGGKHDMSPQTVYTRVIDFTDCPPGKWEFFFENMTIMLPQER